MISDLKGEALDSLEGNGISCWSYTTHFNSYHGF